MRFSRVVPFLILFFGFQCFPTFGQVVATWTDTTGNWSNAANWSTNPVVPNNGGGRTYSVVINVPSSVVTMDVLDDTIDNLTLGAGNSLSINSGDSLSFGSLNSPSPRLDNNGALTNGGTLNTYILNNNGTLTNNGALSTFIPTNSGKLYNASGATLESRGAIENTFGASVTNYGSITLDSGFDNRSGANLTNFGTIGLGPSSFNNSSGAFLINNGTIGGNNGANFFNSGMVINNSAISFDILGGIGNNAGAYFANSGTISVDAASFGNAGRFSNSGTINVTSQFDPGFFSNSGTFNNSGTMNLGLDFFHDSSFSNSGTFNNSGTMNLDFSCPGGCVVSSISNSGALNNNGTLNLSGGPEAEGYFANSGTINNAGTINNSGVFKNSGAVLISGTGLFTTSTNYTQTAGSTFVNGTLTATSGAIVDIHGGVLGGTGTINGNVLMAGTMMPGDGPGTLKIFGSYEQTGTGFFDELMSPYSQAFLDVSGNAVLDPGALLEISLLGGFNPLGSTISIMDFSTLSGQFANGSSFWDDNYLWDITYRQHEIDVTAVQAPEPSSLLLVALGSLAIGAFVKRTKSHNGSLVGRLT